jgi:hypothetical protein
MPEISKFLGDKATQNATNGFVEIRVQVLGLLGLIAV